MRSILFICIVLIASIDCAVMYAQWDRVSYQPEYQSLYKGFALDDDRCAIFGPNSTIGVYTANEFIEYRYGGANEPTLNTGCRGRNDSIWVFGDNGVALVSDNEGATWIEVDLEIGEDVLACAPGSDGHIIYSTSSGTYRLVDGASTKVLSEASMSIIYTDGGVHLLGATSGKVFTSSNDGLDWLEQSALPKSIVEIDTIGGHGLALTADGSIFLTTSAERFDQWERLVNAPSGYNRTISSHSDTIFLSGGTEITVLQYFSGDRGQTWTRGMTGYRYRLHGITAITAGVLFHGEHGFFRFAKTGQLYDSLQFEEAGLGLGRDAAEIPHFTSLAEVDKSVWMATSNSLQGIWKSVDGGTTWEPVERKVEFGVYEYRQVVSYNGLIHVLVDTTKVIVVGGKGVVVNQFEVFTSADKGESWTGISGPIGSKAAIGLVAANDGTILIYGADSLYRLDPIQGDVSSIEVENAKLIADMNISPNGLICYLGVDVGVSTDNGKSWTIVETPDNSAGGKQIAILDDQTIAYAFQAQNQIVGRVRQPGSDAWRTFNVGLPKGQLIAVRDFAFSNDGRAGIVTQSGFYIDSRDTCKTFNVSQPNSDVSRDVNAIVWHSRTSVFVGGQLATLWHRDFGTTGVEDFDPQYLQSNIDTRYEASTGTVKLEGKASLFQNIDRVVISDLLGRSYTVSNSSIEYSAKGIDIKVGQIPHGTYAVIVVTSKGVTSGKFQP